eukprot:TRINITY_DN2653_c0_g1_i1.p1 TRINITY_DN2653_c0_g1~~TRINITY_DN2653_c0_g1_i1.p1  ORF type:complete len:244 (-),score=51.56 TRINITY_DN2653_c0_g1_i1:12-743(-)
MSVADSPVDRSTEPPRVYFAGPLFDTQTLIGNLLLAARLQHSGQFLVHLPQDHDASVAAGAVPQASEIRDKDFCALASCDVGMFHFDGSELDSGTVAELMFARSLGMPCVIVRSDFRLGGDAPGKCPWNAMLADLKGVVPLQYDSLKAYREVTARCNGMGAVQRVEALLDDVASRMEPALKRAMLGIERPDVDTLTAVYQWQLSQIGASLEQLCVEQWGSVRSLVEHKLKKLERYIITEGLKM